MIAWLRRRSLRRFTVGVLAGVILIPPTASDPFLDGILTGGSTDNACWEYSSQELAFRRKMNRERVDRGKGRLSLDPELSKSARVHTREMVERDLLHHTTETDLRRRVSGWSSLGENVGVGATVDSLHRAFMASPPHRANILYPTFRHVGIGVVESSGRMWVTVLFSSGSDPGTTLRMPRC